MTKGLENLGNTCYFNAALQCMLQVPQLSNYMIMKKIQTPCECTLEYQKLVKSMWLQRSSCENPLRFFTLFKNLYKQFDNREQQDSHEMIMCLLDVLDTSIRPFKPVKFPGEEKDHSLIKEIFYGQCIQETISTAGKTKRIEDTSCIMAVLKHDTTLDKCLDDYTKWIFLDNYKDDDGKFHHVTTTRTLFWYMPYVLIVSFKMYTGKFRITLPQEFDASRLVHPDSPPGQHTRYSLFATCTHHGSTRGGHYIAYTKHHGQWYSKDDGCVSKCTFPESEYHYIAFYKCI
jgi:ubiquitin C-terminal hydrolase